MFLKCLTVYKGTEVIREIPFHKGLNLIVDETKTEDRRESGNNVGKTTVLRLIDYCFGGSGKNIYKDPEFKDKAESPIESFLKENNIVVALVLKESLDLVDSKEIEIRRNFLSRSEKILEINGEPQKVNEFADNLKTLVFRTTCKKPSLRDVVSKNIRDEKNRLTNTLRVLNTYATQEQYEAVYLFWLGIDVNEAERKQELLRNRKTEEALIDRLRKSGSLSQIEQSLIVVNREIKALTKKKDSFNVNEKYEEDLAELNQIKLKINACSGELSNLEMRKELILESERELVGEKSLVDVAQVRALYDEAKLLLPTLQKTFEDALSFHNEMVQKKIEYITQEFSSLESRLASSKREIQQLLSRENELATKLGKTGVVDELQEVVARLNKAFESKGGLEEQKRLWNDSKTALGDIEEQLAEINESIGSKDDLIQSRITEFNSYFSEMSSKLYGEQFVLSSDRNEKGYELNVTSLSGNLGTGKKKGQMAAFDLAYIQFADAAGIPCLHFVLQDQIENVHDNQITSLLTEIVSTVNCQYVLPVLRDKLPGDIDVSLYQVVSLSQADKLFRV